MSNGPSITRSCDELEYLDLEQAAAICAVSDERFNKWVEKGIVPIIHLKNNKLIRSHDLIQHLIRHNIPVPDRLLQGINKKILFILNGEELPQSMAAEIVLTLFKLRRQTAHIFDFVHFGEHVELKIIALCPDIIVLLTEDVVEPELKQSIRKMVNDAIPVYSVTANRTVDLETLFSE